MGSRYPSVHTSKWSLQRTDHVEVSYVPWRTGPFTQISGMKVGEGMEGHGTKCDCTLSVCFTLLVECVLQGNVVDRRLVQGVNCRLGSECLTGFGVGSWL